ncbi:family 31 glycoside hydrolase [Spathaspora passalidarum NRRL Y-27907]|uniref:alpha-D-xyloside xylohydrolase n=1 Tax=Spathaspora passalidarum (strain NRRL Y-27907 / 11-Y1) TaxID=619300 RepID=G3APH9_SPAPN|nr:family 31 glycoside hydrolase [Spathaspora passalidarum NRRL Y-27907]EGW32150.1 family 31 glycoside hydrolase [Spathaspora passalidarum NRRL Y-27907]
MEHYSIDRHVESDTRFSRGMWELKQGVRIDWALENLKSVVSDGEIYSLAATRRINNRGDTLNCPTISTIVSSPREGIVGVESYHHVSTYKNNKEPKFLKYSDEKSSYRANVVTSEDESVNTLYAGASTAAEITSKPFAIDFKGKDKVLTKLGYKSIGFVRDTRFEKQGATADKATTYMTVQLHLSVGEKLFGLGEKFGPFVKNGQRVEVWNEDGGTSSEWGYKSIPFYLSNRGYGVFVDSPSNVVFELQSERTTRVNITVQGEGIKYYIIHGPDPKTILQRYTDLTGKPALPPAWTFGLWLTTSFTTNYDIDTVSSFIQGMKDRNIPLGTFHFDCFWMKGFQWCDFEFDPEYFPDAKKSIAELKKKFGVKICVWINSYIGQESKLFAEADDKGYLIRYVPQVNNGASYQTDLWQAGMGIVDFTNPDACKWYQSHLEKLIDMGVDSFKTDFGERIPIKDIRYHDGSDPVAMHNYYTLLYNKLVFETLESKLGKNEACLFARSATTGGQQYPVHWGGDCESTFEAMAETLRGGLSLCLSGFGFWSHDIGGFEGDPNPAIYKRWCAFGLLSSHSRLHGSTSYRVPWNFDDEASVVLSKFTKLKLSLMPYLYKFAIEAHKTGIPVMRALMLEYPHDPTAVTADTEYFLGDSLLVAPVFTGDDGNVTYYVPKGDWYGWLDGEVRSTTSGEWFDEVHDYKSLPLLVRPNSIIVTAGPYANHKSTVYDWNKEFMVNIYDVTEAGAVTEIPDPETPDELAAKVIAKKSQEHHIDIKVEGKFSKPYYVKVLDSNDKELSVVKGDGKISGKDELGNTIVEVSSDNIVLKSLFN